MVKQKIIQTTGKRKTAVARLSAKEGSGLIRINNLDLDKYTSSSVFKLKLKEPLLLAGFKNNFDFKISINGGGVSSRVDAIRQALARSLLEMGGAGKEKLRLKFQQYDRTLLISDVRVKETCKPNGSKARAKRQKSYR